MLNDSLHEGSCSKRGIRFPLCALRSIPVIGHAPDKAERVLPVADDALNDLIKFSVAAKALVPCGEVLTHLLPFQHLAVKDGSAADDGLVAVQVPLHLLPGGQLRVSDLDDCVRVHVDEETVGVGCGSREVLLLIFKQHLSVLDVLLPRAVIRVHLMFVDQLVGDVLDDWLSHWPTARFVAGASLLLVELHALAADEHHAVGVWCRDNDVPETAMTVEVVGLWRTAADAHQQHMLYIDETT